MQVKIGKIVKPQGLKGEVKIQLSTNNLAVFNNLRAMYIGPSSAEIEYLRLKDNFVIVKFKQINDIDKAELLRGKEVFVDKKDFVLEQDNYLIEDLIDCSVYDENNNFIGKFVDVEQYGAADIWIIYADGRDYYVPFLKQIFTKVLPQQKIIIINKKAFDENKICQWEIMKIDILTLFPEMFAPLNESILKRAKQNNIIDVNLVNIRDFSLDPNKRCDDYCYGGGSGMLMTPQPLYDSIKSVLKDNSTLIYLSPKGQTLNDKIATDLSKSDHLVLICGHYEGIDERILEIFKPKEISIGDYVLTGGELPAMVLVDCVARKIEGVLGNSMSEQDESFKNGLLEYPQYTRPADFMGYKVPEILLSGNHQKIDQYRKEKSVEITKQRRSDLIKGDCDEH